MQAHFEVDNSAYPIGYIGTSADGFRVHDMRTLKALHSQVISVDRAEQVCAEINAAIRAGACSYEDVKDRVTRMLESA